MIVYRHVDSRFPFLSETADQPEGRWHEEGDGPVQYFADTPEGAWAELLRHEEIHEPEDLATIRRALWAVEVRDEPAVRPDLPHPTLTGGLETWVTCQAEGARLRASGTVRLEAPSAALLPGGARGWRVDGGLREATPRDGSVVVLYGARPDLVGWQATAEGRPGSYLLGRVRHLGG